MKITSSCDVVAKPILLVWQKKIFFWLKRQGLTQSLKFLYYIILLVSAFHNKKMKKVGKNQVGEVFEFFVMLDFVSV